MTAVNNPDTPDPTKVTLRTADSATGNGAVLTSEFERRESHIAELNSRIARLAIALHVPLERDEDVMAAMQVLSQPEKPVDGAERRTHALRAELRGLLVLRYGAERHCVEDLGVQATKQLMAAAEAQLQREGFTPGADGVNLDRLFDTD